MKALQLLTNLLVIIALGVNTAVLYRFNTELQKANEKMEKVEDMLDGVKQVTREFKNSVEKIRAVEDPAKDLYEKAKKAIEGLDLESVF
jgi:hypothetical protein